MKLYNSWKVLYLNNQLYKTFNVNSSYSCLFAFVKCYLIILYYFYHALVCSVLMHKNSIFFQTF